jgi:hypothetical protein
MFWHIAESVLVKQAVQSYTNMMCPTYYSGSGVPLPLETSIERQYQVLIFEKGWQLGGAGG